jgi:hypothetical protein
LNADTKQMQLDRKRLPAIVAAILLIVPHAAAAQNGLTTFLGGAATAFAAHESGHLLLDAVFGSGVDLRKVNAGPFPFFAITHHPVSPVREFAISSAGFWVQHATDELILTGRPQLRTEHAPFLKGMLAFNTLTSAGYAVAAFTQRGPAERDTRGIAISSRLDEPWIGAAILLPAAFDAVRFYRPEQKWAKWASRATKIGGALLIARAAN